MSQRLAWALGMFCGLISASALASHPYPAVYVFGDSLSDTGNNPPLEADGYAPGRWSNGPLWIEYFSEKLGVDYNPDRNFAVAGARCADAYAQSTNFPAAADITNALCVVWAGGNDFRDTFATNFFNDAVWKRQLNDSVNSLSNTVASLYGQGARFVLVPNAVDLSRIPAADLQPAPVRTYLRKRVQYFNGRLNSVLKRARRDRPGLQIFRCDVYGKGNALLKKPARYGFAPARIDALSDPALLDKSLDGPGADYVFWDPIHPTTRAHAVVADWFYVASVIGRKP